MSTQTKTVKTAILALIIVSATLMGGCLTDADTAKTATTVEMEKYELNSEANVIETPDVPEYRAGYSLMESGADLLAGIGHFTIVFSGLFEVDNTTVSGSKEIGFDKLESVEIFVNNESVAKFIPTLGERNKIETTQVGDWNIRIEWTFIDGSIVIKESQFSGMRDMSDHPDYKKGTITVTGDGPFDARYIEPSTGMSREDAKKFCEENGIVWGCDDEPTTTPTLTSTKVTPTVMPTVAPTPEPEPELPKCIQQTEVSIYKLNYDDGNTDIIGFMHIHTNEGRTQWEDKSLKCITHLELTIDGSIVASFDVNPIKGNTQMEMESFPKIIHLSTPITTSSTITVIGSYTPNTSRPYLDGDFTLRTIVQRPPEDLATEILNGDHN